MSADPAKATIVVYVACVNAAEIMAFRFDPQRLTLQQTGRFDAGNAVAPLAAAPNGRRMYAMLRGDRPAIATLSIEPARGTLALLATAPVSDQLAYLETDRSGQYLLGASYSGSVFAVYRLDDDGGLTTPALTVTSTPPRAHCARTDPSNRFVFVTSLGGDVILQFHFDAATGKVVPNDVPFVRAAAGSGPRHLAFHPEADVVYVNGELDGSITTYDLDPRTGRLTEKQRIDTMPPDAAGAPWSADLHVTPDGRFVYASERRTSTIARCAIRRSSHLLEPPVICATSAQPRSIAFDPPARSLFVAGEAANELVVYNVDPQTGVLSERERHFVGDKPAWVSVVTLPG